MSLASTSKVKISQLQAFVAVVEHGNFSAAALELGLTQSTISHAIATLEEELGIVLFVRGRHGAVPTPIGEQVLQEARQVLQLLETIQTKANLTRGLQGGQIRIASVRSITTHVLPNVIARYRKRFPMVGVVILEVDRYVEVEQALREGHADLGFTSLPTSLDFEVFELFQDEFVVLLPPNSLEIDEPISWEQLTRHPMIMNLRNHQHNKAIYEHLLQFGYTLTVDYEVREDSTIIGMVEQGLGATIIARLLAKPLPEKVRVRSLPVPLKRVVGVAVLADALLPQAVFAFLDVLKEEC